MQNKKTQALVAVIVILVVAYFLWTVIFNKPAQDLSPNNSVPITSGEGVEPGNTVHDLPVSPTVASARVHLAATLGIDILKVVVLSEEARDWPDSCLGLGGPGVFCAQVVTPGYEIKMIALGKEYTYRTNATGSVVAQVK